MNTILRPPDHLTQIVGSCGKAIISSRKIGQSPHLAQALFPNEPEVDIANVVRRTVESRATPALAERLRIGSLRNTYDDALGIFNVPCDAAVWSAKCAQVREQAASPQRSVPVPIRQSGIACHPTLVIDAVSPATRAAEIGQVRHLVLLSCLCCFRPLCMHRRQNRRPTDSNQTNEKNLASSFGCELCCHIFSFVEFFHDDTLETGFRSSPEPLGAFSTSHFSLIFAFGE